MIKKLALFFITLCTFITAAPKISIITPIYKGEEHIQGFLKDITKQTIFNQCELIFINAHSPEKENRYIQPYLSRFPNIKLFNLDHATTMYDALNIGIEKSRGEYLYFAAVDNRIRKDALEVLKQGLENSPAVDLVYGDYFITDKPNQTFQNNTHYWEVTLPEYEPHLLAVCLTGPQPLWRKSVHETKGIFDESFVASGNWEFWNRISALGSRFKRIPETLTLYYYNPKGVTTTSDATIASKRDEENRQIQKNYVPFWLERTASPPEEVQENLEEKPFVIMVASYNNTRWVERNLNSIYSQKYQNYRVIYVDDCSTDGTGKYAENYIKEHNQSKRTTLIQNATRVGALANQYTSIHLCEPNEIVVIVDGDDWLENEHVLSRLNREYQDEDVWLTYGQFEYYLGKDIPTVQGRTTPLTEDLIKENSMRVVGCEVSHLRTFYAGLFQRIDKEDLQYQGKFFEMNADLATTLPMLEMAGFHSRYIPDLLYVYNRATFFNDDKVNKDLQNSLDKEIRSRKKYQPLENLKQSKRKKTIYVTAGMWGDLFARGNPIYDRDDSLEPLVRLKDELKNQDIEFVQVQSIKDLDDPYYIFCFEHPGEDELESLKQYPKEKRILFLWEPPTTMPQNYDLKLHDYFGKIYTFADDLVDNEHYFKLHYPRLKAMIETIVTFSHKKFLTTICSEAYSPYPGELYSARRKMIQYFDQNAPKDFEFYGKRWNSTDFSTYRGSVPTKVDTLKNYKFAICYENLSTMKGYVTEKIFDCFQAGCVPIYLGAPNITDYVPENCFIDRRKFKTEAALHAYLQSISEEEYNGYLENIRAYLESTSAFRFSTKRFIRDIESLIFGKNAPFYFCTGSDSRYFPYLLHLIGCLHKNNFDEIGEIAVFDLGLDQNQIQSLKSIEKVSVQKLEMTNPNLLTPVNTRHWGKPVPGWYAWKPVCVKQGLDLYPDHLWIDAGTTVNKPLNDLFAYIRQHGSFFHSGCDWKLKQCATRYVIDKFGLNTPSKSWILESEVLEAGLMGITAKISKNFVLPMYEYSKDLRNFGDDGSTLGGFGTGRHDIPLFSMLALENHYPIFYHFENPRNDFYLDVGDEHIPFHISCVPWDCKESTAIYCSRNDFNFEKVRKFIRYKNYN